MGDVREGGKYKNFQKPVLKICTGGGQGGGEVCRKSEELLAWFACAGEAGAGLSDIREAVPGQTQRSVQWGPLLQ